MVGAPRKLLKSWCRRRDLNPHGGEPHRILSPARLPFHHSGTEANTNNEASTRIQERVHFHANDGPFRRAVSSTPVMNSRRLA